MGSQRHSHNVWVKTHACKTTPIISPVFMESGCSTWISTWIVVRSSISLLRKACTGCVQSFVYFLVSTYRVQSLLSRQQRDNDSAAGYLVCARLYRRDGYVTRPVVRTRRSSLASWVSLYYSEYSMLSSSYDTLSPIPTSHTHRRV